MDFFLCFYVFFTFLFLIKPEWAVLMIAQINLCILCLCVCVFKGTYNCGHYQIFILKRIHCGVLLSLFWHRYRIISGYFVVKARTFQPILIQLSTFIALFFFFICLLLCRFEHAIILLWTLNWHNFKIYIYMTFY